MSRKHPIVALARPSGVVTPEILKSFGRVFRRKNIDAAIVQGDGFHRYSRIDMKKELAKANSEGNPHFFPFWPGCQLV